MPVTSLTSPQGNGSVVVRSTEHTDLPTLKNNTGQQLSIAFRYTGTWCLYNTSTNVPALAAFTSQTDCKGYRLPPEIKNNFKFRRPQEPAGALLVELYDPAGNFRGVLSAPIDRISIDPGWSYAFVVNDDPAWYSNNSGSITVFYDWYPISFTPATPQVTPTAPATPQVTPTAPAPQPAVPAAQTAPGKLLLFSESMITDHAFKQAPDTRPFVLNMAKFLSGSSAPVKFLSNTPSSYPSCFRGPDWFGDSFVRTIESAGHSFELINQINPNNLLAQQVKIVIDEQRNLGALLPYLRAGGNVVILGQFGMNTYESGNQFLAQFGMSLVMAEAEGSACNMRVTSPSHPLFSGVRSLFIPWGNRTIKMVPNAKSVALMSSTHYTGKIGNINYIAVGTL